MTIQELLDMPAVELAKLSDAELTAHLVKYFPVSRPSDRLTLDDIVPKSDSNDRVRAMIAELQTKAAAKPRILAPPK